MKKEYYWVGRQDGKPEEIIHSSEAPKMLYEGGKFTSLSGRAETFDELKQKQSIQDFPCCECGGVVAAHFCEPVKTRMLQKKLCFYCNHWVELLDVKDRENVVRVKGCHYMIEKDAPTGQRDFSGFGGSKFHILFNDGRDVITHNLWHQGEIPNHFKDRLPDNAKFV